MSGLELDFETADRITLLTLKGQRKLLKEQLAAWRKNPRSEHNPTGVWLHPEDVVGHTTTVNALDLVIKYFGG